MYLGCSSPDFDMDLPILCFSTSFSIFVAMCSIEGGSRNTFVMCSLPEGARQKSVSSNRFLFQDMEKLLTIDIIELCPCAH